MLFCSMCFFFLLLSILLFFYYILCLFLSHQHLLSIHFDERRFTKASHRNSQQTIAATKKRWETLKEWVETTQTHTKCTKNMLMMPFIRKNRIGKILCAVIIILCFLWSFFRQCRSLFGICITHKQLAIAISINHVWMKVVRRAHFLV